MYSCRFDMLSTLSPSAPEFELWGYEYTKPWRENTRLRTLNDQNAFVLMTWCFLLCIIRENRHEYSRNDSHCSYKKHKKEWTNDLFLFICLTIISKDKTNIYTPGFQWTVFPVTRQGNSLESYFRGSLNITTVPHEMCYEWIRLRSFSSFTLSSTSPSPVRLARSGFSFTGRGQECVCFSCGIHNSD